MAIISYVIVTLWLLFWILGTAAGLPVPAFEAAAAMAYLTPLLGLYFGRRWTSDSNKPVEADEDGDSGEEAE